MNYKVQQLAPNGKWITKTISITGDHDFVHPADAVFQNLELAQKHIQWIHDEITGDYNGFRIVETCELVDHRFINQGDTHYLYKVVLSPETKSIKPIALDPAKNCY